MAEKLDLELQRKESLKQLLTCEGWKIYKEKLQEFGDVVECDRNKLLTEVLTEKRYDLLNYHLGQVKMLKMVTSVEEEFEEEISSGQDVKEGK